MTPYTLVLIDVQEREFVNLLPNDRMSRKSAIVQAIQDAINNNQGLIVCEFNPKKEGVVCDFVLDLIANYPKCVSFEHFQTTVGEECLAITRQRNWDRNLVKLASLSMEKSNATRDECLAITNFQMNVDIA